jgi:exosortase/archaeosortase family protein
MLTVNGIQIELINACIAGAAYYLLVLLNLSTKGISALKRLKIFLFSAGIFLLFNIIRIVMLTMVFLNYPGAFDFTHAFFWYGISTIAVVLIWIFSVKFFEIKNIPLFSDIKAISVFLKRKPGK